TTRPQYGHRSLAPAALLFSSVIRMVAPSSRQPAPTSVWQHSFIYAPLHRRTATQHLSTKTSTRPHLFSNTSKCWRGAYGFVPPAFRNLQVTCPRRSSNSFGLRKWHNWLIFLVSLFRVPRGSLSQHLILWDLMIEPLRHRHSLGRQRCRAHSPI